MPKRTLLPLPWLLLVYAGLGYLAVWGPWRLALAQGRGVASNPIDGLQWISLLLLVLVGGIGGRLARAASPWWALTTMAAFPVLAFADMLRDPTSHNLWPIEFVFYGLEALPAVGGAAVTRRIGGRPTEPVPGP